jgi:hypothetical protein
MTIDLLATYNTGVLLSVRVIRPRSFDPSENNE